ncbi:MAG: hypothetical protein ACD_19C00168G0005 [uncultured bacterium]|uniref:histidine kinase n=1 Tax=Candidatus Collierbacteria bacterium GW2011_GWE1_46_18 TaxID=1618399 RepID=A0A0G1S2U2_9BACT|nr:MAG: hypothetical protein ACD_19C00168G0005 [uncultured bacterium]KKU27535.1 MAG: hypothetical protein UX41_C0048G0001 [Candidatus Collierbacteria bacterium GW2011_GWE1_46_18]HCR36128.1 hypothetical protein [Candidatus Woesebacteria bacterium]
MIYHEIRVSGEIIASNVRKFVGYETLKNLPQKKSKSDSIRSEEKEFENGLTMWLVVENESDIINSNRLFSKTFSIYENIVPPLFDYYLEKIRVHSHTLRSIQGKMKQKIDGLASKKDFRAKNYKKSKEKIGVLINKNIDRAADIFCQLNKRIAEIDAHVEGFDVLYLGDKLRVSKKSQNIKKILLNIVSPFLKDFESNGVEIVYTFKDEYALQNKIEIDYKLFNLAYSNFIDNAIKYTMPNSKIIVNFTKSPDSFFISITMTSIRIDQDEKENVFDEGYSGRYAEADAGDGIGMSVIRKALRLTGISIQIECDYSKSFVVNGRKYVENTFVFKGE